MVTRNFGYTGAAQTFIVPPFVTSITVMMWGAQGGSPGPALGGKGAFLQATLTVTGGETLQVNIGGAGNTTTSGGFNGGGGTTSGGAGGTGGGASDVRRGAFALTDRLLVAGGGGGGGYCSGIPSPLPHGGGGGAVTSGITGGSSVGGGIGGGGGTQSAGGSGGSTSGALGVGGDATGSGFLGGAGGGGYYGGGGGQSSPSVSGGGGGGGSSLIGSGATAVVQTSDVKAGDGAVVITYTAPVAVQPLSTKYLSGGYSAAYPADALVIAEPAPSRSAVWSGQKYGIMAFHGHGGGALDWVMGGFATSTQLHWQNLIQSGYYGMGPDLTLPNWGDPQSVRTMDDAYTYMTATMGCHTKIGLLGYSMGGLTALNWALRNPTKVSAIYLFAPATDLDYFNSTAGYAPSYGTAGNSTWTAEVQVGFTQGTTVSGSGTIPVSTDPTGIAVNVADAKQMAAGSPVASTATLPGGTFTYTNKLDGRLTGCRSTSSSTTVAFTAGQAITSTYAQQSPGYSPLGQAAALAALANTNGFKVRISHATDDVVVPPGMTTAYQAAWNASGFNSLLEVNWTTGNHTGLFSNVPYSHVIDHFDATAQRPSTTWGEDISLQETWAKASTRLWSDII